MYIYIYLYRCNVECRPVDQNKLFHKIINVTIAVIPHSGRLWDQATSSKVCLLIAKLVLFCSSLLAPILYPSWNICSVNALHMISALRLGTRTNNCIYISPPILRNTFQIPPYNSKTVHVHLSICNILTPRWMRTSRPANTKPCQINMLKIDFRYIQPNIIVPSSSRSIKLLFSKRSLPAFFISCSSFLSPLYV
jgi:hypothetical protein